MPIKNDKVNSCVVVFLFLATCGVAFGLPFLLSGVTAAERHQAKLTIPTGEDYITATRSTERVLTIEAFATLFFSPTVAPTTAFTSFPTATLRFTQTSLSFTSTSTFLPTFTAQTIPVVTIRPTFTFTPTKIVQPGRSPTSTSTAPYNTPVPTKIITATASRTPIPSVTYTLVPTLTFTPKPIPTLTFTPAPPPTDTPTEPPPPADTPTEPPPEPSIVPTLP